ncbi:MAG: nucleoside deaminase [Alphaproteobacteria bacterium]|nr:nucleoside deaminase [Alphaproteobacteria bacterium]
MEEIIAMALSAAKKAGSLGEVPIAAVLFRTENKEIISVCANRTEELQDATAHAEILALKEGFKATGSRFLEDFSLFVTLEPCPMCATAISYSRIKALYFGAYDVKGGGIDHGCRVYAHQKNLYRPEVTGGLHEDECRLLLQDFFKDLRKNK